VERFTRAHSSLIALDRCGDAPVLDETFIDALFVEAEHEEEPREDNENRGKPKQVRVALLGTAPHRFRSSTRE
jgi:hypothetical protein